MKSWFKNAEAARRSGPHLWPSGADAATRAEAAASHWAQAKAVVDKSGQASPESVSAVFQHLDQILILLLAEVNAQDAPGIGPVLEGLFLEDVLGEAVGWALGPKALSQQTPALLQLLKLFEGLVTQSAHCLLVHKPILLPLLKLLQASSARAPAQADVEKHFVLLLNQLCTKMAGDASLLEFFFNRSAGEDGAQFAVFTLLIPYLYEEGDIGQLARDATLLVLAVSRDVESVGHFIGEHSSFCPVLASGLSGCFSQLPRQLTRLLASAEDWHCVTMADVEAVPALNAFYGALVFANAVLQAGHSYVTEQLMEYIYNGFLESVVAPSLCEPGSAGALASLGLEEVISGTAYVELCLRAVTEPAFLRLFVRLLFAHGQGEERLLDVIVSRVSSTPRLSVVTLRLLRTLVELDCEDLMVQLVLQYLIPATHALPSQAARLGARDFYARSAARFLSLLPVYPPSRSSLMSPAPAYSPSSSDVEMESTTETSRYIEYLNDARTAIEGCRAACAASWAQPYDGVDPDPALFRDGSLPVSPEPSLSRGPSLRRSRPNSYGSRRHTSGMTTTSLAGGPLLSAADLAILGPEEVEEALGSSESEAPQSQPSTPRFANERVGMGADMFRLTYEDEMSMQGDSESDMGGLSGGSGGGFVLRGWSEVADPAAFLDVLNRVRTASDAAAASLQENADFLDKVHRRIQRVDNGPATVNGEGKTNGLCEPAEAGMSKSKDSGMGESATTDDTTSPKSDVPSAIPPRLRVRSVGFPVYHKGKPTAPTLGPFLGALLDKLAAFPENSLYVNLQLTGVLARLAVYPQPLLSSFLLNAGLILQPSVQSLFMILLRIKKAIEDQAETAANFGALVSRGRRSLAARARRYRAERGASSRLSSAFSTFASLGEPGPKDRASSDSLRAEEGSPKPRSASDGSRGRRRLAHVGREGAGGEGGLEGLRTRAFVYAAIVFEDFLFELSALCQEHAVLSQASLAPISAAPQ